MLQLEWQEEMVRKRTTYRVASFGKDSSLFKSIDGNYQDHKRQLLLASRKQHIMSCFAPDPIAKSYYLTTLPYINASII